MKTTTHTENHSQAAKNLSAAAVIATLLVSPTASSFANPFDALKAKVQQATSKVTELKNNVQAKVEDVKEKVEGLDDAEFMEIVRSLLQYAKQARAGYQQFVGADKCGPNSPCGVFRAKFRNTLENFIKLPGELPFVEHIPPAVQRLAQFVKVIDFLPPPILFATEKVLGNAFDEIQYRLDMLRYAVSQAPRLPTMAELSAASAKTTTVRTTSSMAADGVSTSTRTTTSTAARTSNQATDFPVCVQMLENGKAKQELVTKSLEHLGDFLWDLADMMEEKRIVGTSPGVTTQIDNPIKEATQLVGFVIKTIRQTVEIKIAATAAICEARGYQAQ